MGGNKSGGSTYIAFFSIVIELLADWQQKEFETDNFSQLTILVVGH